MSVNFGPGFHVAGGQRVDRTAYDRYLGSWSRLFVPAVLAAAEVAASHRILMSPRDRARWRRWHAGCREHEVHRPEVPAGSRGWSEAAFAGGAFDSVICQLGLMFFPDPRGPPFGLRAGW
jgi:hypothetical protein